MCDIQTQIEEKQAQCQSVINEMQKLERVLLRLQGHLDCLESLQKIKPQETTEDESSIDTDLLAQPKEQK